MGNIFSISGTPHWRVKLAQAKTTALLSVLFIVVYGGTNWITSQRSDVGLWFFEWERNIPFVPLMILPYMSIDIFFVAAPFLCWDEQERRTFAQRVTIAILIAGFFFPFSAFTIRISQASGFRLAGRYLSILTRVRPTV